MANKNPPRKTTIRGQRHLLAYITPDEAALLKARGGTGELHKGIPSYPPSARGGSGLGGSGGGGYEGGRERSGMQADRGSRGRDRGFDSGYKPVGDFAGKELAEKKLTEQVAKGKKGIEQMTGLEKLMAAVVPGAGFETAQNFAAQIMGNRMKNVLSEQGSRAVISPTTGRVEGVYDAAGRLTGRDTKRDRERAAREASRGGSQERAPLFFGAGLGGEEEQPKKAKEVIRTDLAKEIEQERTQRRKAGVSQLSRRSLLSNVSRLGV